MPRAAGQIDQAKNEAILDAAMEVLAERGLAASMDEIARRACVSKQTIYNHYGGKADLVGALAERRVKAIVATLHTPEAEAHPESALAAFAQSLLSGLTRPQGLALMRLAIESVSETPDLARALFDAGPMASRAELARFLKREMAAGRLQAADPYRAAEFFSGMVMGARQMAQLLGAGPPPSGAEIESICREAALRFMRAYGV